MKTIKGLLVFGLLIGAKSVYAGCGASNSQGWNVSIMTGTSLTIGEGRRIFLKQISASSASVSQGDYVIGFATVPAIGTGAGVTLMPNHLFIATQAVTQPLLFPSTTTVTASNSSGLTTIWSAGNGDDDCVGIPGNNELGVGSQKGGALHFRKSTESSGAAGILSILWSN